jgi:hypothetical protein
LLTEESEEVQRRIQAEGEGEDEAALGDLGEEGEEEQGDLEGEGEEEEGDMAVVNGEEGGDDEEREREREKKPSSRRRADSYGAYGEDEEEDEVEEDDDDDDDEDEDDSTRRRNKKKKPSKSNRDTRFIEGHELDGLFDDMDGGDGGDDADSSFLPSGAAAHAETPEDPLLQANWNLASYLSPPAAVYFNEVVSKFLYKFRLLRQQLCRRRDARIEELALLQSSSSSLSELGGSDAMTVSGGGGDEEADALLTDEGLREAAAKRMHRWIQGQLLDYILHIIDEPEVKYSTFPQNAGSHLQLTSPSLELVKAVTHVLALDRDLENEVKSLRRALLAHLQVREFDSESNFRDPCLSYVLRDVICSYCSTCRDLDLLRDLALTSPDKKRRWRCSHCENSLDTVEVENRLLQEVVRISTAFLLQDAYCSRTKAVNTRLCAATSDLAATLTMSTPPEKLRSDLHTLLRVAQFHGFNLLVSTIKDTIG